MYGSQIFRNPDLLTVLFQYSTTTQVLQYTSTGTKLVNRGGVLLILALCCLCAGASSRVVLLCDLVLLRRPPFHSCLGCWSLHFYLGPAVALLSIAIAETSYQVSWILEQEVLVV